MGTKQIGDHGEHLAAAYLEAQGYTLLARNYRFERAEVDLVCFEPYAHGGEVVFAEVKTRRGLRFGRPEEAVTDEKQRNIIRAARAYLYEHKMERAMCRFDVIAVLLYPDRTPQIEHYKNAFWAN